jgi:hypothetical protein
MSEASYRDTPRSTHFIILAPWLILLGSALLLAVPRSRPLAEWLLSENRPVELLTFLFLLWAAIGAARIAQLSIHRGEHRMTVGFYTVFAFLCFVVAMEEIAWGQQFLGFATPDFMKEINAQGELTLHNFHGHNSATELFVFGAAGLFGVFLSRFPALRKITPPRILLSWFLAIALAGGADAFTDQTHVERLPIYVVAWIGEIVEMLIGMASVIYVSVKRRELAEAW